MNSENNMDRYFRKIPEAFYYNDNGELRRHSVHFGCNNIRFRIAEEQAQKEIIPIPQVKMIIFTFLKKIGVPPVVVPLEPRQIDLPLIKQRYGLSDPGDLLWLKLSENGDREDGNIVVIGTGPDIGSFDLPPDKSAYGERDADGLWRYCSSSILLHYLNQKLDKDLKFDKNILLFPLALENCPYRRREIANALGNFLAEKHVAIIDRFSCCY